MGRIQLAALSILLAGGAGQAAQPPEPPALKGPIVYTVDTPFQGRRVVILQSPDGLSAAHRPYEGEPSPLEPGGRAGADPDALNWRFAGPRTGGRLAQFELGMLSIERSDPLERGLAYVDYPRVEPFDPAEHDGEDAWSASDIRARLERGADDRLVAGYEADHHILTVEYTFTTYQEGGEPAQSEDRRHVQHLWLAPQLPYSPLQIYPGLGFGYALSGSGKPMIDLAVLDQIRPSLLDAGAVVRSRQPEPRGWGGADGPLVMEITPPEPAEPLDRPELEAAPVVPERLLDAVVGPLFMAEMLQNGDAIAADGDASMTVRAGAELSARTGRAAYTVTGSDDFALAVSVGGPDSERAGLLVLMRPVNGAPQTGEYAVAGRASHSQIQALSQAALGERARRFQAFGVIETEQARHVLTGFVRGDVQIEASGARIAGQVEGAFDAVRVDAPAAVEPIVLEARFDAVEGLDRFSFRSPESRAAD